MGTPYSQTYGVQRPSPVPRVFSVEITRITAAFPRRVYVQWTLRKPPAGSGFTFNVYRSGSPEGPWEELVTGLANTYFFVDENFGQPAGTGQRHNVDLMSLQRTLYYRVTCTYTTTTVETVAQLEAGLDRRRRGLHRKLVRDANKALKLVVGTEMATLKQRRWGEVCTYCMSKSGQVVRAHCKYCYGTGLLGGYWAPVYGYGQRQRSPVQTQLANSGEVDVNRVAVIMSNAPQVEPGDVLVFLRDAKRYAVELVNPTQIHSVTVHQELQVSELARSAVEYGPLVDPWRDPAWY